MKLTVGIFQVVSSLAALWIVFLAWKQLRLIREQIDLVRQQATTSFEDSLTEHYRRIMESIPTAIWLGSKLEELDKERKNPCRDAIYRYIDLCQEQAFLHDDGRISDKTWTQWGDGIKSNLKIPAFKEVWDEVKAKRRDSFSELKRLLSAQ